jgi:ABC-type sugar transport system ATPase subunit
MIHQELLPFPEMTVAENICMGAEPVRAFGWIDRSAMDRHAGELLARLGVDVPPARLMRDLSFAEQQTVEVAKALGRQADLVIMDEPTSALSERESERCSASSPNSSSAASRSSTSRIAWTKSSASPMPLP